MSEENDPQDQASEPPPHEISLIRPPQTIEQNSSPSVNLPQPDFDVMNLSQQNFSLLI